AFDRRVTLEDKLILESTDPDVPLDASEDDEEHMASDRPGLLMRKKIRTFCDELRKTGGLSALVEVRLAGE
ncbi:MAG: Phenylpropionate dioxygenase (Rieske 2Fe-2S family) protein, partial [Hyphomicrobiales bacterium]|nr:Phenylpropionate dioxygenase (Rieske 2Fe-2S family) protein [Hyphomicrobiales bacterium]